MPHPFRVIDTGLRDGRENVAFDQALIDLHREGAIGDTIRFLRFSPTVLVGRHQAIGREVRVANCRENGIGLGRRVTGGGALFLDEGQLGWEIVLSRQRLGLGGLAEYTQAICRAVAYGLAEGFGIDARFRPHSDIEVDGQKICGTGGFFDGDTLFYQGIVLLDMDPRRMFAALNVPAPPPPPPGATPAKPRVTTLKALLGGQAPAIVAVEQAIVAGLASKLDIAPLDAKVELIEEQRAQALHAEEIGTEAFVFSIDARDGGGILAATQDVPGGQLTAQIRSEGDGGGRRIREVLFSGDFFVTPPRLVLDLEAALRGVPVGEAGLVAERFWSSNPPAMSTVSAADVKAVVERALAAGEGNARE